MDGARDEEALASVLYKLRLDAEPVNNWVESCEEVYQEFVNPNLLDDPYAFLTSDEDDKSDLDSRDEKSDDRGDENFNNETVEESDEDENEDADPEFAEVKRKIKALCARGWEIYFSAESMDDAYEGLCLLYDPRGFEIQFNDEIPPSDCEFDMQYLELLRRMDESEQIKLSNSRSTNLKILEKLTPDLPQISDMVMYVCLQDYIDIYGPVVVITQVNHMHDYLFNSDSNLKEEYLQDPVTFRHNLKERFPYANWHFDSMFYAVTQWWTSESEEEGRIAKSVSDFALARAQEFYECRLKTFYTRGDYFKLKLEFARRVGIIKDIPDELADFVLPGQYKWPEPED